MAMVDYGPQAAKPQVSKVLLHAPPLFCHTPLHIHPHALPVGQEVQPITCQCSRRCNPSLVSAQEGTSEGLHLFLH